MVIAHEGRSLSVGHSSLAAIAAALALLPRQVVTLKDPGDSPLTYAPPVYLAARGFDRPHRIGDPGTPQASGPIRYRPRKTQGVFLRRLPDLSL